MRLSPSLRLLFTSAILLAACRGGGGMDDDSTTPDAPINPDDTKIQDIQSDAVAVGTDLTIRGVVVTAIDSYAERADGTRKGNIWIEEPEGGAFSGVLVFGADATQVGMLAVGDLVDVTGASKTEFALTGTGGDTSGRTTTELQAGSGGTINVTKVGDGTVPAPAEVDALAIAQLDDAGPRPTARDNEWEKWEGVLIHVQNVSQISSVSHISMEANFLRFQVTGQLELDTSLAAFPATAAPDICYASITGMGDYFFQHKLLIRNTADLVDGGTGCPAPEEGAALCGDGMDNDYDGFSDCNDFSCQATAPACITATHVADIQMGNVTGTVMLSDLFITSLSKDKKHLWVADHLAAAPYEGVYVYRGSGATVLTAEYVVGAKVNVMGSVNEFDVNPAMGDTLTEINAGSGSVTFVAAPTGLPTPLAADAAEAGSIANGEQLEGVLVKLSHMKVTTADDGQGKVTLTDNNGATIDIDDDIFAYPAQTNGTCYATMTGLSQVQLVDDKRTVVPRTALDMVVGTGCN